VGAADEILATLRAEASERNVAGMARFGIRGAKAYGVPVPRLRQLARPLGRDRALARALWRDGSVEGKILASLLDEPDKLTRRGAERYLRGFENWAETDAFAMNLFDRAAWAHEAAVAWSAREPEFEKRTAFALMAALASHDKKAPDAAFLRFLPVIEREAGDARNFVKKAVSWALRGIGKRNPALRRAAVASAKRIRKRGTPGARWIAADALRELAPKRSRAHEKRPSRPRPRRCP
jgi:3-methyladenine DNA glycosylase AlkD